MRGTDRGPSFALEFHNANELVATQPERVTGVKVIDRRGGAETVLPAEFVVDASGRGARTPAFLENLGYSRPPEDRIVMQVAYASQLLRVPPNTLPPTDPVGMSRFAAQFAPAPMMAALAAAEPLSEVRHCRFRESRWRRYDKMQRLPTRPARCRRRQL